MTHRRVRTWTSRLAITLALLFLVLAVVSGWYSGAYAMQSGSRVVMLGFGSGQGAFAIGEQGAQAELGWSWQRFDPNWRWWFSIGQTPQSSQMLIPLWVPVVVLFVLGWKLRPKRFGEGQCAGCGYAIAGSDAQVCPECGATITYA